ncbi:MAG: hypothetical protein VCC00_13270 [Deltaproteobacteria bacterium]
MSRDESPERGRIHGPTARLPRYLAAAIGLLLAISILDLSLRIEGPRLCADGGIALLAADAELGWTFAPGRTLTLDPCAGTAWSAPVTINQAGLADQEWPLAKRPGEVRVLLLGGALADGVGVARGDRLSVRLAHLADQRRGARLSVINGQIPGYDTARQLLFLEKRGLPYQPDIVVLVLDPARAPLAHSTLAIEDTLPPASGLLARGSLGGTSDASSGASAVRLMERSGPLPDAETDAAWQKTRVGIRRLAAAARASGAGFAILVAPPCPEQPYPADLCAELTSIAPCADVGSSFRSIREAAAKPLELCIDELGRWGRDGHFLASHSLWDLIAQGGLWPDSVVRGYRL